MLDVIVYYAESGVRKLVADLVQANAAKLSMQVANYLPTLNSPNSIYISC